MLFHYGTSAVLPKLMRKLPAAANFPARCVTESLQTALLPKNARALDLGCAVGRATFELARHCSEVIGIDYSARFIEVAEVLRKKRSFNFDYIEEGGLTLPARALKPRGIRGRVSFEHGDAMNLRADLGRFDVVLMANLIDRLSEPRRCLKQLPGLVKSGGQLIITSPYTWLVEYTPRENWLGGFLRMGKEVETFDTLKEILAPNFRLADRKDLPFLIREHARKYQLGIAEASVWIRK